MATTRRVLLLAGGSALLVSGVSWAMTRSPAKALAPWRTATEGFDDPRLSILAYAILAPSPHNMQPWQIELKTDNALEVYCRPDRLLPETDPPNRQITIGFGCFLEVMRLAASDFGYKTEVDLFPEGDPFYGDFDRPIARVQLDEMPNVEPDPLFQNVLGRRTNRSPFQAETKPSKDDLEAIIATTLDVEGILTEATQEDMLIRQLRELTRQAWKTEWYLDRTRRESIDVTHVGRNAIEAAPYGINLSGPVIEALNATGLFTAEKSGQVGTTAFDQSFEFYDKACATAQGYVWILTDGNTRADQITAGAGWVRAHLAATGRGVAFHPLSQALQEFPEMKVHYDAAHLMLQTRANQTVQMLARVGFAAAPAPAPREPLSAKIVPI
ncbi:MAG: twin-arginine translocation pathway signal protein [Pseudomonadota bacterium]